jgi:hypothetical protein
MNAHILASVSHISTVRNLLVNFWHNLWLMLQWDELCAGSEALYHLINVQQVAEIIGA